MSCSAIEDKIEFNNWQAISENFLYENFINDPVLSKEEKRTLIIYLKN